MTNSGRGDKYHGNNRNKFYDRGRSDNKSKSYEMNNQNLGGRNKFRGTRSRGKYNRSDPRIFKEREGHMTEEDEGTQMKS